MSGQPNGVASGELFCVLIGPVSGGKFQYIPGPPTVETAGLMASAAAAQLSLQAVWRAGPEALQAAERAIKSKYPDVGPIDLQPIELGQPTASLTVKVPNGAAYTLGPNPTSGTGQQRVVFSDRLTAAEKAAAISAFKGQSGVMTLSYQGTFNARETSTVKISGDFSQDMKALAPKPPKQEESSGGWFSKKNKPETAPAPPPDLEACAAAIDGAIASGRVKLTRVDTANVSDATKRKAQSDVRDRVAKQLFDNLKRMGADSAYVSSLVLTSEAPASEELTFQISRTADLGDWFGRNGGAQLVSEVAAPIDEPKR